MHWGFRFSPPIPTALFFFNLFWNSINPPVNNRVGVLGIGPGAMPSMLFL